MFYTAKTDKELLTRATKISSDSDATLMKQSCGHNINQFGLHYDNYYDLTSKNLTVQKYRGLNWLSLEM
mgnify:CR=1 FL=1